MLSIYQLSPFNLGYCSVTQYLCWYFFWKTCPSLTVLKSPTIIALLSISFLKCSKIFFMYLGAPMLGACIFTMLMSSWWILPLSIMKWPSGSVFMTLFEVYFVKYEYCYPSFFFLSICLENLFPALTFSLCRSLFLR